MVQSNLVNSLAAPKNAVADAYQAKTQQFQAQDRQRDNDMLKVFEYAGDGNTEAAQYYAKSKGLQVPEQVYQNSDFAKGLALSGKFYGDDPEAAQKFTQSWMQNQGGDFDARMTAAETAAGKPVNKADREYQRKIDFEKWKIQNGVEGKSFSLGPGQTHYDASGRPVASVPGQPPISRFQAGQNAYNSVMQSGLSDAGAAEQARQTAYGEWDKSFLPSPAAPPAGGGTASPGLTGGVPTAPAIPQQPAPVAGQGAAAVTQPPQIPSGLPQGSVMIGTSNGKAVYQDPQGNRYVDDGNP